MTQEKFCRNCGKITERTGAKGRCKPCQSASMKRYYDKRTSTEEGKEDLRKYWREKKNKAVAARVASGMSYTEANYVYAEKDRARQKRKRGYPVDICRQARLRARKAGLSATIRADDLVWPTHCPVLGMELIYGNGRDAQNPANATIDRWDNTKGYEPGNCMIISQRANTIKSNATWQELEAIAAYAKRDPYEEEMELGIL